MAGPQPLTRKVEETLRAYLLRWGQRLVDLQPKVSGGEAAGLRQLTRGRGQLACHALSVACLKIALAIYQPPALGPPKWTPLLPRWLMVPHSCLPAFALLAAAASLTLPHRQPPPPPFRSRCT